MLVIAHRTCPRHEAENSRAGIRRAHVLGADAVEIDVRRTLDGLPVLFHDPITWRTSLPLPLPIRWLPAAVARRLRLRASEERIPTFADALAVLAPLTPMGTAIDIKHASAAPATVAALRTAGMLERARLWSQHESAVEYCVRAAPGIEVSLLRDTFAAAATAQLLDDAGRLGAHGVSVHWDVVTAAFLDDAHERGLVVYSWCQWRDRQGEKLGLALDGIVTDWPDETRALYAGRSN